MNSERVQAVLNQALEMDAAILSDRTKLNNILLDLLQGDRLTRNILMMAYDEGVVTEIAAGKSKQEDIYRYQKRIIGDYGISEENARSAIGAWCRFYGVNISDTRDEEDPSPAADIVQWKDSDENVYDFEEIEGEDGVRITGYLGFDTDIEIPNMIQGRKVLEIGENAFKGCIDLETVVIPEGIKRIGVSAFECCRKLRSVHFPAGLEQISDKAFFLCRDLEQVYFEKGLKKIENWVFAGCGKLRKVHFPEGLTYIGNNVFWLHDEALEEVVIPSSVQFIGKNAIQYGTILCQTRSYAIQYAHENGIKCARYHGDE